MDQQEFQTLVLQQLHDLRAEIREVRTELKGDISDLRTELKGEIAELKTDMKTDRQKLEEIYQARNSVKIKFGWQWGLASFVLAITAAGITQVFD